MRRLWLVARGMLWPWSQTTDNLGNDVSRPARAEDQRQRLSRDHMQEIVGLIVARLPIGIGPLESDIEQDRPERFKAIVHGLVYAKLSFNFAGRSVAITKLSVAEGNRKEGYCRRFIQNLYRALEEHGFERIELTASFDGRFVWARLGFQPVTASWKKQRATLTELYSRHREELSPVNRDIIAGVISADHPAGICILANSVGTVDNILSPKGASYTVSMSVVTWDGELKVGSDVHEQFLFGRQ